MPNDIHDQLGRVRNFAEEKAGFAGDKLKEGASAALESLDAARETAVEALETSKDIASHALETSKETASRAYAKGKNTAYDLSDKANRIFQEHPLTAVAAAVTAGAILASVMPRGTRKAIKAKLNQTPALIGAVARSGKEAADTVAGIASRSATTVRQRASKAVDDALDTVDTDALKSQVGALVTKAGDAITAAGKAAADTVRKKTD